MLWQIPLLKSYSGMNMKTIEEVSGGLSGMTLPLTFT